MTKKVADLLVDVLAEAGVRRIYGVVGDSLNGITDSIRIKNNLEWVHVRHEESGAFAAGAEAHLTGTLAVCAGSCGPGNMHLINGLYDCQRLLPGHTTDMRTRFQQIQRTKMHGLMPQSGKIK